VNSVTKRFNIFMSSLIMTQIVVDLLNFVILRTKSFDSCAAFSMATLFVYVSCHVDVDVMNSCVEPRNSASLAD